MEAYEKLIDVLKISLKKVLVGIVDDVKTPSITQITSELMKELRDKRNKENTLNYSFHSEWKRK